MCARVTRMVAKRPVKIAARARAGADPATRALRRTRENSARGGAVGLVHLLLTTVAESCSIDSIVTMRRPRHNVYLKSSYAAK